ncbi:MULTISPECIES: hypothetical protein [unclassified Haladaptatus]|uniref:hypothetical protein n=1 Tax=unclassified Haladaptatus TaxID=2622732 RepID=UPI0023E7DF15|nr:MULTISPECIES: hypothetical protein [unclassified Haladaptatus]
MGKVTNALGDLVENVVAFLVMIILAIIGFYVTVFVVTMGAELAGRAASGDFVVLSAALLVSASILAGGSSPVGKLSEPMTPTRKSAPADD